MTNEYNKEELRKKTDGELRAMVWNLSLEAQALGFKLTVVTAEMNKRHRWK